MEKLRPAWAVKAIIVIVFTSILFRCVCGVNHTVGGASGWDLRSNIQAWSSSTTFNVGDDLLFQYTPVHDVVEVNQQGYDTCTIANAISTDDTGETVIHLTEAGTRYFVCGRMGHCQQGLKLEVQVQAQSNNNDSNDGLDRSRRRSPPPPPRHSPPPPPLPHRSPPPPPPLAFPPQHDLNPSAEGPCDISFAEKSHGLLVVSLITLIIIFPFTLGLLYT